MKQLITVLLALLLCVSLLAGCRNDPAPETTAAPSLTAEVPPETTEAPAEPAGPIDMEAFLTNLVEANPGASAEELCKAMLGSPYFTMFNVESTEFYYPGLNWEYQPHDIRASACVVDFMTGTGALVYAIEPEDGADAEALAEELGKNLQLDWMYSDKTPDTVLTKVLDGKIFLAMYRADMEHITGTIAAQARDFVEMFHARLAEKPDSDCKALADYFAAHQKMTQMYVESVVPGELTGFNDFETEEIEEVTGFAEGACFNPTMSPNTFIGYVFRLEEGADQEAFIAQLREKANLNWNVCVSANTIITETDGSFVLFMMCTE